MQVQLLDGWRTWTDNYCMRFVEMVLLEKMEKVDMNEKY